MIGRTGQVFATAAVLVLVCSAAPASAAVRPQVALPLFAPAGELDCNGYSRIQRRLEPLLPCADLANEDNGHYIGHDEPEVQFFSSVPKSGHDLQWAIQLPVERPLPATQTFENETAFWLGMVLCDPTSYPGNSCTPDSDVNSSGPGNPRAAGSAFLEMQFYPPGLPPWPTSPSCDTTRWCAALAAFSLECSYGYSYCNPNCVEPVNFAFIQRDGVPTGPPGPGNSNISTFTPNSQTLLMNQGDKLRVTIKDSTSGLLNKIEDLTTGQSGFMYASVANGFQHLDLHSCAASSFAFRPEFSTAKFTNMLPWSIGIVNIAYAPEIGHFIPGAHGDGDNDDLPCFTGPVLPGCQGSDVDFDGTSYRPDWPDGTKSNASTIRIESVVGNGIGPVSMHGGGYSSGYASMQFVTGVAASEPGCRPNGTGCTMPPPGAAFYPFYALSARGPQCILTFGNNIRGSTTNNFGGVKEWGAYDQAVPGTFQSGEFANPCTPHA
jgi:hypothetical protein